MEDRKGKRKDTTNYCQNLLWEKKMCL